MILKKNMPEQKIFGDVSRHRFLTILWVPVFVWLLWVFQTVAISKLGGFQGLTQGSLDGNTEVKTP